jgi:GNAT superfamily N-acetyltransferase
MSTHVVDYSPGHRDAFRDLNLEWIERFFAVEESDLTMLNDPEGTIIDSGGFIFVALDGDFVVGVCSLVPAGEKWYQLAKMAVSPASRGKGTGRRLAEAAIARARAVGAERVELFSNTVLEPAISLYRSLGFVEVPLDNAEHRRSNIRMVLALGDLLTTETTETTE